MGSSDLRFTIVILYLVLTLLGSARLVLAEEIKIKPKIALPEGTLDSEEVFYMFNNHTVYSVTAVKGRESVSYYDPKGEVRQLRNGIKRTGHWRVTDSGRICLQMEDLPEKCRIIVKEKGVYKKYIVRKNGKHQHSITYQAFRYGNPLGL